MSQNPYRKKVHETKAHSEIKTVENMTMFFKKLVLKKESQKEWLSKLKSNNNSYSIYKTVQILRFMSLIKTGLKNNSK